MKKSIIKRDPAMILFEALLVGQEIKFPDGYIYAIKDGFTCIRIERWHSSQSGPPEIEWLRSELEVEYIIKSSKKFTDDELFVIGCQTVLMRKK